MSTELADIHDFIKVIEPFNQVSESTIGQIINQISICYVREGEPLPPQGIDKPSLYFLRKGALAYFNVDDDGNDELLGKYGEGDICSVFCRSDRKENIKVIPEEDTLLCVIDYEELKAIIKDYPDVYAFFMNTAGERLQSKVASINEEAIVSSTLMNMSIADFYHSPAVTINCEQSIQDAAIKMTELGFSCLVVVDNEELAGIVTDKDLRRRCIAEGLSVSQPVTDIMTTNLQLIDVNHSAHDALIKMTSQRIHHLPVTKNGKLAGMVTVTDLMNQEGLNAVNMASTIRKANTVCELAKIAALLPKLQIRMAKLGTTADHVGKTISAITGSFTMRLIDMAEKQIGPAPVPYAWMAAGSQARQEQFAHSDQDNALIISDDMKPEDDKWFADLAKFVSDGLAACNFIYCPGNVMATNPKWRQPAKVWAQYFDKWINQPEPLALMNGSIFFDLNTVCGDESLLAGVREKMLLKTQTNTLFIAHLSGNALKLRPPLGFFRDFVLVSNGKNKKALDLKHNGIAPIVDLARIYALSEGIEVVNTIDRLRQAAGTPSLSSKSAANLIDAYEFLGMLRVEHQARQLQANIDPDNYLLPKEISRLEREHLKDAFKVIKTMQSSRQTTYS
ncbi:MAG: putative nucleotidyltransferase substrate binding domain-containing protein [Thalassotalea sp.]|nr:putative nucleotidyltransferase substrate binding domain-containing protein [Thalassotalea sp.]MDG2392862.1 putative nucleotidyltransferase substrate binding domain-containing protein [Thalassotalea sp.]